MILYQIYSYVDRKNNMCMQFITPIYNNLAEIY